MDKWYYERVYKRGRLLNTSMRHCMLYRDSKRRVLSTPIHFKPYSPIKSDDLPLDKYLEKLHNKNKYSK